MKVNIRLPFLIFTLLRQEAPWLATGRNGNGFGGFRFDAPQLAAESFTLFFLAGCFEQKVEVEKGNRVICKP